jgi:hypothetical protein
MTELKGMGSILYLINFGSWEELFSQNNSSHAFPKYVNKRGLMEKEALPLLVTYLVDIVLFSILGS